MDEMFSRLLYLKPFNCVQIELFVNGPVSWGCSITRLHPCRASKPLSNEWPRYDTKQYDGEAPVTLELWGT